MKEIRPGDEKLVKTVINTSDRTERSHSSITLDAETRYALLQKALLAGQEFDSTFSDFGICLKDLEARIRDSKPLDARLEKLDLLIVDHEVCPFLVPY